MAPRPIRLFHRGRVVSVDGVPPTRSVLDWLRDDLRCTGTKEGCNEGDCGACTVVIGELRGDALALKAVNACTMFVPMLDGCALLTVEDIGSAQAPHPVQQAMIDCHGSQCGFCTPGFVMSLFACYENRLDSTVPTRRELADALAGNLCRCTGYRPILDAGHKMFELAPRRLDRAPIVHALRTLRDEPPLHYRHGGLGFFAPRTLDELAALRERFSGATLVGGATDIALWVTKQLRDLGDLIHVGRVDELQRIAIEDGALTIGAAASLEAAWHELARHWPSLREMGLRFGSPAVRNAGTMGGNVANGSPIGDSGPVLMALGAELLLRRGAQTRRVPLDDFYTGYMTNRLEPGEFVQAIRLPLPAPSRAVRAYKISKRFDCDISAVAAGLAIDIHADGIVRDARFAYGGMAATVRRAHGAEQATLGKPWNPATLDAALHALASDFEPLTDHRASAAYRTRVAGALLRRFWLETQRDAPLATERASVWAAA